MKKILVSLIACFCVLGVSAQEWAVGGRVGSGFQAQGEYHFPIRIMPKPVSVCTMPIRVEQ